MKDLKVVAVNSDSIEFSDGVFLRSWHDQDCCEEHSLTLTDISLSDFDGLLFDLSRDDFFKRVDGYGIELIPIHGHSVKIPAHGYNNGYYSSNLDIVIEFDGKELKRWDISDCQVIND
jgi:hypothetical protein